MARMNYSSCVMDAMHRVILIVLDSMLSRLVRGSASSASRIKYYTTRLLLLPVHEDAELDQDASEVMGRVKLGQEYGRVCGTTSISTSTFLSTTKSVNLKEITYNAQKLNGETLRSGSVVSISQKGWVELPDLEIQLQPSWTVLRLHQNHRMNFELGMLLTKRKSCKRTTQM